jgi:hypothetical protein
MSEFDHTLTQLFASARETLPAEDFVQGVATVVSHARRKRAIGRTALALAAVAVAGAATPYIAAGSLTAVSHVAEWLPALASALSSPVVWLSAVAVAAWGLHRARRVS